MIWSCNCGQVQCETGLGFKTYARGAEAQPEPCINPTSIAQARRQDSIALSATSPARTNSNVPKEPSFAREDDASL